MLLGFIEKLFNALMMKDIPAAANSLEIIRQSAFYFPAYPF